jgi:signal transduction histidine kinase
MTEALVAVRATMAAAGVALLATAVYVDRRGDTPGVRPFAVLVGVLGAFAVADGLAAGDVASLSLVWVAAFVAIPSTFTWFVVEYHGLPHLGSRRRKALFAAPALLGILGGGALILATGTSGSMSGGGPTGAAIPAPLGFAAVAEQVGIYYGGGVMVAGVALLARTVDEYGHLSRSLAGVLSVVAVWPWLAYLVTPAIAGDVPLAGVLSVTAAGYVLSLLAVLFAVTRGGLFDAAPAAGTLGPSTVLANLTDPVVVVDRDERVVRVNDAAGETFGVDAGAATGSQLDACLGVDLATLRESDTVDLAVPGGSRQFEAAVSPVEDRLGRVPGTAVVLTDVTQERVRSQRLGVLNRVLRHNLRNEMTTIAGYAQSIARDGGEHADAAATIADSADDLLATTERAREVESIMATSPEGDGSVALRPLAAAVVADHADAHPDADFSVDVDDDLHLAVDDHVITAVLDNLVENAVEHNDAPTSVVTVSARRLDDRPAARVSVSDNGPGLPEHERAVLERGTESALDHGSGLGLWAVKWGAVRLGADLSFKDGEPEGTVVTLTLPTASEEAPTSDAATATAD